MRQIKIPEELYHCFEAAGYRQHYEANEDIYMQNPPFFHNVPDRSAWQQLHRLS